MLTGLLHFPAGPMQNAIRSMPNSFPASGISSSTLRLSSPDWAMVTIFKASAPVLHMLSSFARKIPLEGVSAGLCHESRTFAPACRKAAISSTPAWCSRSIQSAPDFAASSSMLSRRSSRPAKAPISRTGLLVAITGSRCFTDKTLRKDFISSIEYLMANLSIRHSTRSTSGWFSHLGNSSEEHSTRHPQIPVFRTREGRFPRSAFTLSNPCSTPLASTSKEPGSIPPPFLRPLMPASGIIAAARRRAGLPEAFGFGRLILRLCAGTHLFLLDPERLCGIAFRVRTQNLQKCHVFRQHIQGRPDGAVVPVALYIGIKEVLPRKEPV